MVQTHLFGKPQPEPEPEPTPPKPPVPTRGIEPGPIDPMLDWLDARQTPVVLLAVHAVKKDEIIFDAATLSGERLQVARSALGRNVTHQVLERLAAPETAQQILAAPEESRATLQEAYDRWHCNFEQDLQGFVRRKGDGEWQVYSGLRSWSGAKDALGRGGIRYSNPWYHADADVQVISGPAPIWMRRTQFEKPEGNEEYDCAMLFELTRPGFIERVGASWPVAARELAEDLVQELLDGFPALSPDGQSAGPWHLEINGFRGGMWAARIRNREVGLERDIRVPAGRHDLTWLLHDMESNADKPSPIPHPGWQPAERKALARALAALEALQQRNGPERMNSLRAETVHGYKLGNLEDWWTRDLRLAHEWLAGCEDVELDGAPAIETLWSYLVENRLRAAEHYTAAVAPIFAWLSCPEPSNYWGLGDGLINRKGVEKLLEGIDMVLNGLWLLQDLEPGDERIPAVRQRLVDLAATPWAGALAFRHVLAHRYVECWNDGKKPRRNHGIRDEEE